MLRAWDLRTALRWAYPRRSTGISGTRIRGGWRWPQPKRESGCWRVSVTRGSENGGESALLGRLRPAEHPLRLRGRLRIEGVAHGICRPKATTRCSHFSLWICPCLACLGGVSLPLDAVGLLQGGAGLFLQGRLDKCANRRSNSGRIWHAFYRGRILWCRYQKNPLEQRGRASPPISRCLEDIWYSCLLLTILEFPDA